MTKPQLPCIKCGQPRYWRAKTGMCGQCSRRDPATNAKKSETVKKLYVSDPEFQKKQREGTIAHNRSEKMRALAAEKAKGLRIWEKAQGTVTPEGRKRAGKRISELSLAHIPPEMRDDYRTMRKAKIPAKEAARMIMDEYERKISKFRQKILSETF